MVLIGDLRPVFAGGTAAGVTISNLATISFSSPLGGSFSATSNLSSFKVDEIVRLNVAWQDASQVTVIPGSLNQYITLALTNTGNGTETFVLSTDTALGGDQFDPTSAGLFLDSNINGIYEPLIDLSPASNLVLAADQKELVFVANDIPDVRIDSSPYQDGDIGLFDVNITSSHGDGPAATVFVGAGDNGGTAIFGHDFPLQANGQYTVEAVDVNIVKTAVVEALDGGNHAQPRATITYTLVVSAVGSGTVYGLTVTDPIPDDTTYLAGSLTLDGVQLTDETDGDIGETSGTPVDLITVNLGDQGAGNNIISFKVTIDE